MSHDLDRAKKHRTDHLKDLLQRLIHGGSEKQYHYFFQRYHEADIADALETLSDEDKQQFFQYVSPQKGVDVLEEMELEQQIPLISEIKTELAAKYITEMEPDDAADLFEELYEEDEKKATEIMDALPKEEAADIQELLSYEEGSAGSIMTSEFVWIPEDLTVKEALDHIKAQNPPESEVAFYIFITDENKRLRGYTTLRNLLMSQLTDDVQDMRHDYPIKVYVEDDQESVARTFQKYDLAVIPVIDHESHLVGIVTVDDVVDVVVDEATEDLYKLSGTSEIGESKLLSGRLIYSIQSRLPWLVLTILGGIVASYIIKIYSVHYHDQNISLVLVLSFVPLLMGLGGNIGNQSSTIMVRGLATGLLKERYPLTYIMRELCIGFSIGLIVAFLLFIFTVSTGHSYLFSIIVSVSLLTIMTVAALIGSALPIIFNKLNIDPAVASAPFISSTLDIVGQLIYFSMTIYFILLIT
ncbi:MAG: magnesium transporter [Candidatus Margulisbacteria bacterium]|nr:magnesium transporter [Candidatus Margulisiibacteriota bacterium]